MRHLRLPRSQTRSGLSPLGQKNKAKILNHRLSTEPTQASANSKAFGALQFRRRNLKQTAGTTNVEAPRQQGFLDYRPRPMNIRLPRSSYNVTPGSAQPSLAVTPPEEDETAKKAKEVAQMKLQHLLQNEIDK